MGAEVRKGHWSNDGRRTLCGRSVPPSGVAATMFEFDVWWEWGEACRTCDRIVRPPMLEAAAKGDGT